MARPRTATETLKTRGSFNKHPERAAARASEPKDVRPVGDAPPTLAEDEAACWRELQELAHPGVMAGADRWSMEAASRLMAKFRRDWLTGAELSQLVALLGRFGMTPADRSKVKVSEPKKQDDPFAEFLN